MARTRISREYVVNNKPFLVIALMVLALHCAEKSRAQSSEIPDCEKIGRAATWIIYIGYSEDEPAQAIFERARGPKEKDRFFSDLPWDHARILAMIEEIQAFDVILDSSRESLWLVGQYGRYFTYQCYEDDAEFLPLSQAKPIIDDCMKKHGRQTLQIEMCVVSQSKL